MSLPRLLAGLGGPGATTLASHEAVHGELPVDRARRSGRLPAGGSLVDEIRLSGLRGRGGAGFPLATKLTSVAAGRGRPIVVVNGCEGEPASEKDRVLLERVPHLVIDGATACARALDAERIFYAIDADNAAARWALESAIAERPGVGRRGSSPSASEVVGIPAGYVSGQETAIVNFINGGRALPSTTPPMVFERGVSRRPTLVTNSETVAQVGLIARYGAEWFREIGTDQEPGSALVSVSGGVLDPGVLEVELGASVDSLLAGAGGTAGRPRAFLFGGYGGGWIDASQASGLAISERSLRQAGGMLGPGVVVVLPESACPVTETALVAGWLERESAGQCGPCVHGLAAIAGALRAIADGRPEPDAIGQLARWSRLVTGRGACGHPDGAARFVTSALRVFAPEFADHAAFGRCPACARIPVLPLPSRLAVAA
jgi:NADH:ubiquinone oxidoreductase subunit F (NADH-binding)